MTQETMALYRQEGTNPFSSCLPILVQSPFFFGLFRVLNGLQGISEGTKDPIGPMTRVVAKQAEEATLFGAQALRQVHRCRDDDDQDRHDRAHRPHVGDDVHDAAPP